MRLTILLICCALSGMSCKISSPEIGERSTEIAANVLVVEPGLYRATSGTDFVDVTEESPESVTVSFRHVSGEDTCGSKVTLSKTADSPWLMCWDEQNRCWVYVADDQPQEVHRFGHSIGAITVTTFDRVSPKEGVPSAFMERLPAAVREAS